MFLSFQVIFPSNLLYSFVWKCIWRKEGFPCNYPASISTLITRWLHISSELLFFLKDRSKNCVIFFSWEKQLLSNTIKKNEFESKRSVEEDNLCFLSCSPGPDVTLTCDKYLILEWNLFLFICARIKGEFDETVLMSLLLGFPKYRLICLFWDTADVSAEAEIKSFLLSYTANMFMWRCACCGLAPLWSPQTTLHACRSNKVITLRDLVTAGVVCLLYGHEVFQFQSLYEEVVLSAWSTAAWLLFSV